MIKPSLENYFATFRQNIIGNRQTFETPFGVQELLYADWTASGRAYKPIEECLQKNILPFVGNTHTETTVTGTLMSQAYEEAKHIIKQHVNADNDDALLFCGSGMTAAVNKLQRILGLRIPERVMDYTADAEDGNIILQGGSNNTLQPVVFVTEMEHHSNHISWLETIAAVEIIPCGDDGNVNLQHLEGLLQQYKHSTYKIAAVTACSNVTGIETPYYAIARLMHKHHGLCFVDFACSAPYVNINLHPAEEGAHLDAVYFSMHKFLGGPGTPGILVFNKSLYNNIVPDQPGGGTVMYTNPWRFHAYVDDIEQREDGGTPPFLQAIKVAMCIKLKEQMGVENMRQREDELLHIMFNRFAKIPGITMLEGNAKKRLGIISFIVKGAHYTLFVKILNDRFGIQTRGGCSCAGTYGHRLLNVDKEQSYKIYHSIRSGDMLQKPGWVRLSVHPTMSNADIEFIMDAIELTASNYTEWSKEYNYNAESNTFIHKAFTPTEHTTVKQWFECYSPATI